MKRTFRIAALGLTLAILGPGASPAFAQSPIHDTLCSTPADTVGMLFYHWMMC